MRKCVPPTRRTQVRSGSIHQRPRGRRVLSDIDEVNPTVWQRLSLKQLRWTALALILVVTAAFGGLKTAHHVTSISFGQTYTAGAVRVTPHSVSLTDHWVGLPDQERLWDDKPAQCHYLVLAVTIQNTANESVPFPLPGVIAGMPDDCNARFRSTEMFGITGVANHYGATFRGHESIIVPSVEPGFTNDYSVLWAISRADLKRHPQISIRFSDMHPFISTFLIATRWGGDADHYAELRFPTPEMS
jgi:hypothetical protein